jgi:hypothetical protein
MDVNQRFVGEDEDKKEELLGEETFFFAKS